VLPQPRNPKGLPVVVHPFVAPLTPQERVAFALAYPFDPPRGSYLFAGDKVIPLQAYDPRTPQELITAAGGVDALDLAPSLRGQVEEERVAVLASGSNASDRQLARKFAGHDALIPTLKAELEGFSTVYAAHFAGYGSLPATLFPAPGAQVQVFVNFMTKRQLARMNETEGLGTYYDLVHLAPIRVRLEDGFELTEAYAYSALGGAAAPLGAPVPLSAVPQSGGAIPGQDQAGAQGLVQAALGVQGTLEAFVHHHIVDKALRTYREDRLRAEYSVPFVFDATPRQTGGAGP